MKAPPLEVAMALPSLAKPPSKHSLKKVKNEWRGEGKRVPFLYKVWANPSPHLGFHLFP